MNDNIRIANEKDIPRMSEIFMSAFSDERQYVDFFMKHRFKDGTGLVYEKDDIIVSQLFLFPVSVSGVRGFYLYGAATDENYRSMGCMGALLHFAESFTEENGKDFIFLVPGEEGLKRYYKRFGYEESFTKYIFSADRQDLSREYEPVVSSHSADKAVDFLKNCGGLVEWDEKAILYSLEEFLNFRGTVSVLEGKAFASVSEEDDTARAVLICSKENLQKAFSMLLDETKKERIEIITPLTIGKKESAGMVLTVSEAIDRKMFDNIFVYFEKE